MEVRGLWSSTNAPMRPCASMLVTSVFRTRRTYCSMHSSTECALKGLWSRTPGEEQRRTHGKSIHQPSVATAPALSESWTRLVKTPTTTYVGGCVFSFKDSRLGKIGAPR